MKRCRHGSTLYIFYFLRPTRLSRSFIVGQSAVAVDNDNSSSSNDNKRDMRSCEMIEPLSFVNAWRVSCAVCIVTNHDRRLPLWRLLQGFPIRNAARTRCSPVACHYAAHNEGLRPVLTACRPSSTAVAEKTTAGLVENGSWVLQTEPSVESTSRCNFRGPGGGGCRICILRWMRWCRGRSVGRCPCIFHAPGLYNNMDVSVTTHQLYELLSFQSKSGMTESDRVTSVKVHAKFNFCLRSKAHLETCNDCALAGFRLCRSKRRTYPDMIMSVPYVIATKTLAPS